MSRSNGVHEKVGPCWCGSACHHGGFNPDASDLRFDDTARKAYCKRTGEWVMGAYAEGMTTESRRWSDSVSNRGKGRGFQHRHREGTHGGRRYVTVTVRGKKLRIAVAPRPNLARSTASEKSTTRRDRRVVKTQASTPTRSRRGVVRRVTDRARRITGLAKRDGHGNLHDPATGRFTSKR